MCLLMVKTNPALGTFPKVFKSEAIKAGQLQVDVNIVFKLFAVYT